MPKDFELLLQQTRLQAPEGFANRIMDTINQLPVPEFSNPASRLCTRLTCLTFMGTGLLSVAQLLAFIFGIWTATSAG